LAHAGRHAPHAGRFYGWTLVGVLWLVYGLGISPAFYSWGILLRESSGMRAELALTAAQSGLVFSIFQYMYHLTAPGVAIGARLWGLRWVIAVGCLLSAAGFAWMATADSLLDAIVGFGVLGGGGVGLSMFVAPQTLAANWFRRYRARATATVMTAGGVLGFGVYWLDDALLAVTDWRGVWWVVAAISSAVAVLAAVMVRDRPADLGQRVDGVGEAAGVEPPTAAATDDGWTAASALRTPQFALCVVAAIAFGLPWGSMTVFLPVVLEEAGFLPTVATGILSARVLISTGGRFLASAGDYLAPHRVLALALILEGAGTGLLAVSPSVPIAYLASALLGAGFGAAYVSVPIVLSAFFGLRPFASINGVVQVCRGVVAPSVPALFGLAVDLSGSYTASVGLIAAATVAGGLVTLLARAPAPRRAAV